MLCRAPVVDVTYHARAVFEHVDRETPGSVIISECHGVVWQIHISIPRDPLVTLLLSPSLIKRKVSKSYIRVRSSLRSCVLLYRVYTV